MKLGTVFAEVMGNISVAALRSAHWQYQQRLTDDGNCQGLYTSKNHAFRYQFAPLSVHDFDKHWWLVQPTPTPIEVEVFSVGIEAALKRIADDYNDAANHRKRVLLDYVLARPETNMRDPVQVRTRGRTARSTQRVPSQFEYVAATLNTPVQRRRCRICKEAGHNARTCRQTPAAPSEPEALASCQPIYPLDVISKVTSSFVSRVLLISKGWGLKNASHQ
uniref:AlNc14C95G5816 protein n=1 Tax=Albugo laibachii Nc14 TaxID=890382 RepID=F0WGT8_9STRA|nr:AlNc14C95G5816 [Albugo laibachii Nc14]|eukprot:CCA20453.1 AlNc14C95G5816 [Albugo laibachii Nc14]